MWKKRKYAGFPDSTKEMRALFLKAIRDAGQTDRKSPLNWDTLFDVLFCVLSTVKEHRF